MWPIESESKFKVERLVLSRCYVAKSPNLRLKLSDGSLAAVMLQIESESNVKIERTGL